MFESEIIVEYNGKKIGSIKFPQREIYRLEDQGDYRIIDEVYDAILNKVKEELNFEYPIDFGNFSLDGEEGSYTLTGSAD